MSESKPAKAHTSEIDDRPTCPTCGSRMWLSRVAAKPDNTEVHTFQCPVCEIIPEKKP